MGLSSSNVRLAVTGSVAMAPLGTAGPVDALSPLPDVWKGVGFISDAGLSESISGEPTRIVPWRSARVARTSPGTVAVSYSFSMLETTVEALGLFYAVTVGEGDVWHHVSNGGHSPPMSFVLTMVDGDFVTRRWLPYADSTDRSEREFSALAPTAMPVTINAYPVEDPMGDGILSQGVAFYSEGLPSAGPPDAPPYTVPPPGPWDDPFDTAFVGRGRYGQSVRACRP